MGEIIFIVGGARSGKSSFAEKLGRQYGRGLVYLATAQAQDSEMRLRIQKHQKRRRGNWQLVEEPVRIAQRVKKIPATTNLLLIDCITIWVSNLVLAGWRENKIKTEIGLLLHSLRQRKFNTIIVTNEVGQGIVPADALTRNYRDILGVVNQLIAKKADLVYQLCCGIPMQIKGEQR